jgi:hypothetical protein
MPRLTARLQLPLSALLAALLLLTAVPVAAAPTPSVWTDADLLHFGDAPFTPLPDLFTQDIETIVDGSNNALTLYRFNNYGTGVKSFAYNLRDGDVWQDPQLLTEGVSTYPNQPIRAAKMPSGNVLAVFGWLDNNITYQTEWYYSIWDHQAQTWSAKERVPGLVGARNAEFRVYATSDGAAAFFQPSSSGPLTRMHRYRESSGWDDEVNLGFEADDMKYLNLAQLSDGSMLLTYPHDQFHPDEPRRAVASVVVAPDNSVTTPQAIARTDSQMFPTTLVAFNGDQAGAVYFFRGLSPNYPYLISYYDEATDSWSEPHELFGGKPSRTSKPQVLIDAANRVHVFAVFDSNPDPSTAELEFGVQSSAPNPQSEADWPDAETIIDGAAPEDSIQESKVFSRQVNGRGVIVYAMSYDPNGANQQKLYMIGMSSAGVMTGPILLSEDPTTGGSVPDPAVDFDFDGRPTVAWNHNGQISGSNYYDIVAPDDYVAPNEGGGGFVPEVLCELPLQVTVSPETLLMQPGAQADVTVTVTNPCGDVYAKNSDVLLSLPAGLTAIAAPDWVLNLVQRVAWQQIVLMPAESKSFVVTVAAADGVTAGPLTAEVYWRGRVANSTTAALSIGAPATDSAAAAPTEVPAAPVVVEAAPALPVALPNTAGENSPAGWPAMVLVTLLLLVGARLRMSR